MSYRVDDVSIHGTVHMISRLLRLFRKNDVDCPEVRGAASDYIDGEMDPELIARISSHLSKCGPCVAFVRTLRATIQLLRSTPSAAPPVGYKDRLRSRLSGEGLT